MQQNYTDLAITALNQHGIYVSQKARIFDSYITGIRVVAGSIVFLIWSRFDSKLKTEQKKKVAQQFLIDRQVKSKLSSLGKLSCFKIGNMPLVKDTERQDNSQ